MFSLAHGPPGCNQGVESDVTALLEKDLLSNLHGCNQNAVP